MTTLLADNPFQTASTVWILLGFAVFLVKPEYRDWLVPLRLLFDSSHAFAFLWQYLLVAALCISAGHCVSYNPSRAALTDRIDTLCRNSRIISDVDDDMRYDTLDLILVVSSTSFSSSRSTCLAIDSHFVGLCMVPISSPVFHDFSTCEYSNVCCHIHRPVHHTVSRFLRIKYCILPPNRHAHLPSKISTRSLRVSCHSKLHS